IAYTSSTTVFPQPCNAAIPAATCAAANSFIVAQLGAFPRFQNQDVAFGKMDYAFSPANRINASFNFLNFRAPNSYRTATTQNNESPTSNGKAVTHERNFAASWSSSLSASTINSLRFQWSRDLEIIGANCTGPSVVITTV